MKPFYKFLIALFLCGLAGGVILYSLTEKKILSQDLENEITEQKSGLEKIRKELEEKRKRIKKLSKKESSVFIQIKKTGDEIGKLDKGI